MPMKYDYASLQKVLVDAGVPVEPGEVYGFILGFICGGGDMKNSSKSGNFKKVLEEFVFDDTSIDDGLYHVLQGLGEGILEELLGGESLNVLFPKDSESLELRMQTARDIAYEFMPGLSITQKQLNHLSKDLNEIIHDLVDISRMETEIAENEDRSSLEDDLVYVVEHISVAAQICFEECAAHKYPKNKDFIIEDEGAVTELSDERKSAHERESLYWEKKSTGDIE
jgi:uncharacterized protein YgfB (UPF0149 family)